MDLSAPLTTGRINRKNFWWSQGVALLAVFLSNNIIGALAPVLGELVIGTIALLVLLALLCLQIRWYVCRARDFNAPWLVGVIALLTSPFLIPVVVMGVIPSRVDASIRE